MDVQCDIVQSKLFIMTNRTHNLKAPLPPQKKRRSSHGNLGTAKFVLEKDIFLITSKTRPQ